MHRNVTKKIELIITQSDIQMGTGPSQEQEFKTTLRLHGWISKPVMEEQTIDGSNVYC